MYLIVSIFVPLTDRKEFERNLVNALSGAGNYTEIIADLMAYAHNYDNDVAVLFEKIMDRYIGSMRRSEYKSLFKKLGRYISPEDMDAVQNYIDAFLETHKSFWGSLFKGKKSK